MPSFKDNRHVADVEGTSIPIAVLEMRRYPSGRESYRHAVWRRDPPVRVFQLWPSLACGRQAATSDGCLSHAIDSFGSRSA